jgi:hypothetical protein
MSNKYRSTLPDNARTENGKLQILWKATNRDDYYPPVLYHPYGLACDGDSAVVVAEGFWPFSRVQLFDVEAGRSVCSSEQSLLLPFDVAFVGGNSQIAATDHRQRTVKFLSKDLQSVSGSWPTMMFDWPMGIAVDARGRFYVTDWSKGTLVINDPNGCVIRTFCTGIKSNLSRPMFVEVDSHRRIIVSDTLEHVISIFD